MTLPFCSSFTPHRPPPIEADVDESMFFLTQLTPLPWALVAITELEDESKRVIGGRFDTYDDARAWISLYTDRRWNLYFTSNVPTASCPLRTTPRKDEIETLMGLHVDLDLPKPPHPHASPSPENLERLLRRLESVEPPPTAVVFSGGGYQALWRFPEGEALESRLHADRVEATNQTLERAFAADHCHNVNRLLRLPGTVNYPDARKRARGRVPTRAYLVSLDPENRWSYARDPIPTATLEESPGADLEDPAPSVAALVDLPTRLQRLIRSGDAADWNGDRSRLVWYVVTNLIRARWADEDIVTLLLNSAYGVSTHVLAQSDPRRYSARQVTQAHEAIQSDWERNYRSGQILPNSQRNLRRALDELGASFSYNTFALRAYVNGASGPFRMVDDDAINQIRLDVDDRFGFMPDKELFHDVTRALCRRGDFHPILDYLSSLTWDRTPRLGRPACQGGAPNEASWLTRYAGAEDSDYTRAVGRLILVAAVRRVREPGCKFDEMLVFMNPDQGTLKSSALQILARRLEWFSDSLPLNATPKQVIEQLSGKWIVESSDLNGMKKSDVEELKRFLSARTDTDRLAYDRYRTELPRQCVFFGTTNSTVFLKDDQNRRFWPIHVQTFHLSALERDVDQLWAEAAAAELDGESIRLAENLWPAAAERQADARSQEPWAEVLDAALGDITGRLVNMDAWTIINKPFHFRTQDDNKRIGQALRELGWERTRKRVDGTVKIVYERGAPAERFRLIYVFRNPVDNVVTVTHDPNGVPENPVGTFDPPANGLAF